MVKVDEEEEVESKQPRPQAPPMRGYNRYDQEKFKPKEGVPRLLEPGAQSILPSFPSSGHSIQDRCERVK